MKRPAAPSVALRRSSRGERRSGSGVEEQDDAADNPPEEDADDVSRQPTHRGGWDDAADTIASNLPGRVAILRALSEKEAQDDLLKKNAEEDAEHLLRRKNEVEAVWSAEEATFGKWTPLSEEILIGLPFWGEYFIKLKSGLILFGKADGDEGGGSLGKIPLYKRLRCAHCQLIPKDDWNETFLLILPAFTDEQRLRLRIIEEIIHMSILANVGPKYTTSAS